MDNSENILRDKKTKNLIPLFTILIILISALILYVSYNVFFGMTPKQYYTNIINNIYEKGKEITDKYDNSRYLNETSIIDGELTLDSNMPGFEEYKNYKLNYNFGIDYKNKKVQLGAGLADNSKTLIDLYTYIEKELLYLKSNTIFSDIISFKDIVNITESDDSENKEISSDDLNYILMKTKDSIINSLDDKDFTTSRDKIMISNKETNVKKISYILDKEKDKKILNNIVNTYKSDDRILDILSKASSSSKEEIKKQFDNYKVEGSDYNVAFNIYVNKNRIVKYEIYNINDDSNKFELLVDNNIYTINYQSAEVIINKKKDNNYLIELNNAGQRIANINYNKENDNKILINYDFNIDKNIINGSIDLESNNEKDKSTYNLNVSLSMEDYNISLTDKHTVEFGKELDTIDSSKAIDSNSLPDDYGENILKNIKEKLAGTPFESLIDIPDDNSYNDNEYYFDSSY